MAKSFAPRSLCKAAVCYSNAAFVRPSPDNCPFTFIRTSGQYGPPNAKRSHTDLSTLYRQHWLLCRRKVREQKRQCVQEQRKERNFSFCHRLMWLGSVLDAKPCCKGKPAVGRSVPEHLLRALPPTPMERISILDSAMLRLNSQKLHPYCPCSPGKGDALLSKQTEKHLYSYIDTQPWLIVPNWSLQQHGTCMSLPSPAQNSEQVDTLSTRLTFLPSSHKDLDTSEDNCSPLWP